MDRQPSSTVPLAELWQRLAREEKTLKDIGLHAHAAGVRQAFVLLLKLADEASDDSQPPQP